MDDGSSLFILNYTCETNDHQSYLQLKILQLIKYI